MLSSGPARREELFEPFFQPKRIPLNLQETGPVADRLHIYFTVDGGVSQGGVAQGIQWEITFNLEFGPFRMTAPLHMHHP